MFGEGILGGSPRIPEREGGGSTCILCLEGVSHAAPGLGQPAAGPFLGAPCTHPGCSRQRPPIHAASFSLAASILIFLLLHVAEEVSVPWEAILKREDTREVGVL